MIKSTMPARVGGGQFLKKPRESDKVQIFQGPQLADDTGLFVHTVRKGPKAFYAVTSVVRGNENREDFSPGNALAEPVRQKPAQPRPVPQAVSTANFGIPHARHRSSGERTFTIVIPFISILYVEKSASCPAICAPGERKYHHKRLSCHALCVSPADESLCHPPFGPELTAEGQPPIPSPQSPVPNPQPPIPNPHPPSRTPRRRVLERSEKLVAART